VALSNFFKRLLMAKQIDFLEGDIAVFDIDFVMQPVLQLVYLNELLLDKLGDNGKALLYDSGKNSAHDVGDHLYAKFKVKGTESLSLWQNIIELSGNAKIDSISSKDGRLVIQAKSVLAKKLMEKRGKSAGFKADHFLCGFLAGAFSGVYGKNFTCRETKCIAEGETACTFVLE
jgi:predicted hydrocarbon binding protein